MRSLLIVILLVASAFALPPVQAKGLAEDPAGDTQTEVFNGPAIPAAMPGSDPADLLAFDIVENAEDLILTLKVASLDQQANFVQYRISFTSAREEYMVYLQRQIAEGVIDERTYAVLAEVDKRWDPIAELDHTMDKASGTFTIKLPKAYLVDERGRYPLVGDELKDLSISSDSYTTLFSLGVSASDRMPDSGELKYAFLLGDTASGHLRLDADDRVRVSNGGSTTFVYQVVVKNMGDVDDEVTIGLSEMPEGWNGTVQSPLRVPATSERRVAVLVSVPFAHDHGGFSSFNLTATSQRDGASGASIRMGVLHTPIPQPAGHHSELYLHADSFNGGILGSLFPFTEAYMNTEASRENDAPEAMPRSFGDEFGWYIPLNPVLRMGLDFDVDKLGSMAGSIIGHGNYEGTLRGELVLVQGEDWDNTILLAETDEAPLTLDLSTPVPFKLTVTPTPEANYIPYVKGQNMALLLYFETEEDLNICCISGTTPGLVTADTMLSLPLNEYHDKLSGLSDVAELLELKAEGLVEKTALPGTTMTYTFTLVNHGSTPETIDLDLAGTDASQGTLVPAGPVQLAAKESRTITLAVNVPTGRNAGEELEVLLFAHAQADPSKSAIARTKTIVAAATDDAAMDERGVLLAAQQAEDNDTPMPGALLLLALAGAALVARTRRA